MLLIMSINIKEFYVIIFQRYGLVDFDIDVKKPHDSFFK